MTEQPTCELCGELLAYDGSPAWYCETCASTYDTDLKCIPDKWDDMVAKLDDAPPVRPGSEDGDLAGNDCHAGCPGYRDIGRNIVMRCLRSQISWLLANILSFNMKLGGRA